MIDMWLKRSTLVFLTVSTVAAMVTSGQAPVTLDEENRRVHITFGSPLTLNCNLTMEEPERFQVYWYFKCSGCSFSEWHNSSMKMFNRSAKTPLVLNYTSNATDEHSGWYYCKVDVDIPYLKSFNSSGTEVVITKSVEHTTYPSLPIVTATASPPLLHDWWLWVWLGVSAVILIVLLVICALLRRRGGSRSGEDPIYANTHRVASKEPSPRPGMSGNNLKKASSSQNLRNPSPGRRYEESKRKQRP